MTWLTMFLLMTTASGTDVEMIAHRGESADAPENTLAAFRLAWERHVTAIELDVHLTRDGSLIVSHDPNTKRTTGVPKAIKESTLPELQKLDAGRWKDPRWAGEPMPTLDQALATIPNVNGARCFIEVKVGPEAVPALVDSIRKSARKPAQLVIISFNAETVAEAKRRLPDLKAYFLASFRRDEKTKTWQPSRDDLIRRAQELHADGLDLSANGPIDAEFVKQVHSAGLELYVWTVDDPAIARKMVAAGVDGITTNKAAWLKAQLCVGDKPGEAGSR